MSEPTGIASRPMPTARGEERIYFAKLREHELVYQRCGACDRVVFPLRTVCPTCGHESLEVVPSEGHGVVYSFTTQYRSPDPAFTPPFTLALVDLAEGFRVLADLPGIDPADARVGLPVVAVFEDVGADATVLHFAPDSTEGAP